MKTAELYDLDFAEWALLNANLLRSGRVSEADLEHIAEEIEDMAKRERRSLHNRFVRLIEHLLKWSHQPERRGSSWTRTILGQRRGIERLLHENPSFRPSLAEVAVEAYEEAADFAAAVTNRPRAEFPAVCPFTLDQLLDEEFLP
ncbi:MAG: DUF29 domain-containing protein [Bryobacteraceae bacterium]